MALATLTLASAALTAVLSHLRTWTARLISGATVVFSIILIQTAVLAQAFHLQPLHLQDWGVAVAGSLVVASLPLLFGGVRKMARV
jgi:Ca2+-transporting ATPase